MTDHKYMLKFDDNAIKDSVTYILVSEFNVRPSILQAKINDNGGVMILSLNGKDSDIKASLVRMKEMGIKVRRLAKQITRDADKCIDCGSCVSICPSEALYMNRDTWKVELDVKRCIACASCLTACPTHAVKLTLPC